MKRTVFFGICFALVCPALSIANEAGKYKKFYEVNLHENYPSATELQAKIDADKDYDKGYDYTWNIGKKFKAAFRRIIKSYGLSEKRLKTPTEDVILEAIKMMPPDSYPYIGPFMHTVPGMSPKILNYPGIKETKNQFPERIAPELQHIEDIEFLSPALYWVLMPEVWQTYGYTAEFPQNRPPRPKVQYNPQFYENLNRYADLRAYIPKTRKLMPHKIDPLSRRTINPEPDSPLTAPDALAVAQTFKGISGLNKDFQTFLKIMQATKMLNLWENEQNPGFPVSPLIKDMANPCRRLIQKFRIIGEERKLAAIAAEQGFTLDEWGYTCDKTVKAHRAANMSQSTAAAISAYRKGLLDKSISQLSPNLAQANYALMQGLIEMYDAPLPDVAAVIRNRRQMDDSFRRINNMLIFHPLDGID